MGEIISLFKESPEQPRQQKKIIYLKQQPRKEELDNSVVPNHENWGQLSESGQGNLLKIKPEVLEI